MPLGLTRIGLSTAPRTDYFWGSSAAGTTLSANAGSFSLGGQAAALPLSRVFASSPASLSIAGQAAGFAIAREYGPLAAGSFSLTGQAAAFGTSSSALVAAAHGSFSLAGQPSSILLSRAILSGTGTLSLAGQVAGFAMSRRFGPLSPGSLTLTGQAAAFQAANDVFILAERGSFSLAGQPAAFPATRLLVADHVAHLLVASPATFVRHLRIGAESEIRQLAGQNAFLFVTTAAGTAALYYRHFHARSISR